MIIISSMDIIVAIIISRGSRTSSSSMDTSSRMMHQVSMLIPSQTGIWNFIEQWLHCTPLDPVVKWNVLWDTVEWDWSARFIWADAEQVKDQRSACRVGHSPERCPMVVIFSK